MVKGLNKLERYFQKEWAGLGVGDIVTRRAMGVLNVGRVSRAVMTATGEMSKTTVGV